MFVKGQSGNPSGRPKMPEDLKKNLKEGANEAVAIWREIQNDTTAAKRDRLKAGELLMAYGYGKAVQAIEVDGPDGQPLGPSLVTVKFADTKDE